MKINAAPLIAVCAAWGVFWGSWSALLPAVKEQLGVSTAELGLALIGTPVGAIPVMALVGRLASGRERSALLTSTVVFALSIVAVGQVASAPQLAVALLVVGATSGALDVTLNMATGRAERESGRRLFQPVHAAFPVAVIAAAPATGLAREQGVETQAILLVIGVVVVVAAASLTLLPMGRGLTPVPGDGARPRRWTAALLLGGLLAAVLTIENAVEQWSVLLLEDHQGASVLLASAAPAAYMAALTAGRLIAQALPRLTPRTLYLVGGVGGGGGIVLAGLAGSPGPSLAWFALAGLTLGPLVPALLSRAAAGDPTGALVSSVSTISYAAFVASPLLVAALAAWLGLPGALACLGLFALPLLAMAALSRPEYGRSLRR
ncbi:MFS transporter [Nonomuraea sp. NPDC049714]|uniref:MFS transporter n=1 Tax=Nonomuraea sp. NPDC049714 TaxID=3364357 RepID=UPI0037ABC092